MWRLSSIVFSFIFSGLLYGEAPIFDNWHDPDSVKNRITLQEMRSYIEPTSTWYS